MVKRVTQPLPESHRVSPWAPVPWNRKYFFNTLDIPLICVYLASACVLFSGVKGTTDSIARIGVNAPQNQHLQPYALNEGRKNAATDAGCWDEGMTQVRPRRVLDGPERALRAYCLEDSVAAALLQVRRRVVALHHAVKHLRFRSRGPGAGAGRGALIYCTW